MKKVIIIIIYICFISKTHGQCNSVVGVISGTPPCDNNPYVIVFEDNFYNNELDLNYWIPVNGVVRDQYHKHEQQWYTPNNIEVNNGVLKLKAKKEILLNQCFTLWNPDINAMETLCQDFDYTSSEIDSKYKFSIGKFEIRCKIPKGKGFWPAFWTYGKWSNEIDVFEFWNERDLLGNYDQSLLSRRINTNIHYDFNNNNSVYDCSYKYKGIDYSNSFHTFSVIWTKYSIEWYVDGDLIRTEYLFRDILSRPLSCGLGPRQAIISKSFPRVNNPMQIVANLAIQCNNGNNPDDTTPFPNSFDIDYIRYYKQLPMTIDVIYRFIHLVDISDDYFNVIGGRNITLKDYFKLPDNKQLKVIARNSVSLESGFEIGNNCNFEVTIDNR
jgi:beta-glucanase (GH16 family)